MLEKDVNNEVMCRIKFHKNTLLQFSHKDGDYSTLMNSNLTYRMTILPHTDKNLCHLKDWSREGGAIMRDVPRSWFEIILSPE